MKHWPDYEVDESTTRQTHGVTYWCDLDTMTRAGRYQATASSKKSPREARAVAVTKLTTLVTKALRRYDDHVKSQGGRS